MAAPASPRISISPRAGPASAPSASPTAPTKSTTAPSRGWSSPSMGEGLKCLPIFDGEGDHLKGGGGVADVSSGILARNAGTCALYPSTTLRVVPLPMLPHGEA